MTFLYTRRTRVVQRGHTVYTEREMNLDSFSFFLFFLRGESNQTDSWCCRARSFVADCWSRTRRERSARKASVAESKSLNLAFFVSSTSFIQASMSFSFSNRILKAKKERKMCIREERITQAKEKTFLLHPTKTNSLLLFNAGERKSRSKKTHKEICS